MGKKIEINPGDRFFRLTIVGESEKKTKKHRYFLCECDCGKHTTVSMSQLRGGRTKSCGCLRNEHSRIVNIRHGCKGKSIYNSWVSMRSRCNNKNNQDWKRYGGRGISICPEWNLFENFRDWSYINGYKEGLTIERKNNNGNYEPNNCTWILRGHQSYNRSTTRILEFNGLRLPMSLMARRHKLTIECLHKRLKKGMSIEMALTEPVKRRRNV